MTVKTEWSTAEVATMIGRPEGHRYLNVADDGYSRWLRDFRRFTLRLPPPGEGHPIRWERPQVAAALICRALELDNGSVTAWDVTAHVLDVGGLDGFAYLVLVGPLNIGSFRGILDLASYVAENRRRHRVYRIVDLDTVLAPIR